jgi:hypothetical protein
VADRPKFNEGTPLLGLSTPPPIPSPLFFPSSPCLNNPSTTPLAASFTGVPTNLPSPAPLPTLAPANAAALLPLGFTGGSVKFIVTGGLMPGGKNRPISSSSSESESPSSLVEEGEGSAQPYERAPDLETDKGVARVVDAGGLKG